MTIDRRWGCVYDAASVILLVAILRARLLHRRRMYPIVTIVVWRGPLRRSLSSVSCHLRDSRVWCAGHRRPGHGRDVLMLMDSRFGVHSFLGTNMS